MSDLDTCVQLFFGGAYKIACIGAYDKYEDIINPGAYIYIYIYITKFVSFSLNFQFCLC